MKQYRRGFTLIELIVVVAIFSIVVLVATNVFLMVMRGYRNVSANQEIQENARSILEKLNREVKTSNILSTEETYSVLGLNSSSEGLIAYFFDSGQIQRVTSSTSQVLNSLQVEISGFFRVQGDGINQQKRATVFMKAKGKGLRPEEQAEINVQTTISQRPAEILD